MFSKVPDQAEGLRRIFHPSGPSLVPLACAGDHEACRRYAAVVLDRFERIGAMPALIDRLDEPTPLSAQVQLASRGRVLLLDEPLRLARWLAGRQARLLLLLSHRRESLPAQYAMLKAIVQSASVREFGSFFVDAEDAGEAQAAQLRLVLCAQRFLPGVRITLVNEGVGTRAAMTDASLTRLPDFAVALDAPSASPGVSPVPRELGH